MGPLTVDVIAPQEQPILKPIGRRLSELQENIDYVFRYKGTLCRIRIFSGKLIDGASIPRLCWTPLGLAPHGIMDGPALPHDEIYGESGEMPEDVYQYWDGENWVNCDMPIQRDLADAILYAYCRHFGVGERRSYLVWSGVRIGGWWPWMRDDRKRMAKVISKHGLETQEQL